MKVTQSEKIPKQDISGNSSSLRGWLGYRTRGGRSGLDPVDTRAEAGFMIGVVVHRLLTGNLRTKNLLNLILMAVLGLICTAPFLLAIVEAFQGDLLPIGAWVVIAIPCLLGIAILTSLINNLLYIQGRN